MHMFYFLTWANSESDHSQIRQGIAGNTKGTAFVVYEDVMDAKQACDKLNGFNFQNRYLVGMYRSYDLPQTIAKPESSLHLVLVLIPFCSALPPAGEDG